MQWTGKARSKGTIYVGDRGLHGADFIAIRFTAGMPVPEFDRGESYVVTIERESDYAERTAGAEKATKAELLAMVVGSNEDEGTPNVETDSNETD